MEASSSGDHRVNEAFEHEIDERRKTIAELEKTIKEGT
jgi:hypothetical protein